MDPQSPPKRMTRARAAAKAAGQASTSTSTSTSASTTTTATSRAKSATTSSKARVAARAASSASTAAATAKRKLLSDDSTHADSDEDELGLDRPEPAMQKVVRAVRGRPRKAPVSEAEPEASSIPATAARAPRGRPSAKKEAAAADPAPAPANAEAVRPSSRASSSTASSAARTARARKTAAVSDDDAAAAAEAPAKKRAVRARATSASSAGPASAPGATKITVRSASATAAAAARTTAAAAAKTAAATKKRVTFEEPEKENVIPTAAAATKGTTAAAARATAGTASTGLKVKPARRTAAATGPSATSAATATAAKTGARSGAATGKTADKPAPAPLSPKKVTQVRMVRDLDVDSEDELGGPDESHLKPLARSPVKPSLGAGMTPAERHKKLASAGLDPEPSSSGDAAAHVMALPPPDFAGGMLASAPRRPPQSPAKEGLMCSPARRPEGLASLDLVMASTAKTSTSDPGNNNHNHHAGGNTASTLFSPAKRFPVQTKNQAGHGSGLDNTLRSPLKMSLLQTPAKRPASPVKAAILLQRPDRMPLAPNANANAEEDVVPSVQETIHEMEDDVDEVGDAVKSEEADQDEEAGASDDDDAAANEDAAAENDEKTESLTQMINEMASEAATAMPDSPTRRRIPVRLSTLRSRSAEVDSPRSASADHVQEAAEAIHESATTATETACDTAEEPADEDVLSPGDPMDVDDSVMDAAAVLVAMSPPKKPMAGAFGLRPKDLAVPDDDEEADSDGDDTPTRLPLAALDVSATPCPASGRRSSVGQATPARMGDQSAAKRPKTAKFGFTPLADKLNAWKAHSPVKAETPAAPAEQQEAAITGDEQDLSPTRSEGVVPSFFDDAMAGHSAATSPAHAPPMEQTDTDSEGCAGLMDNVLVQQGWDMPEFDDVAVTEEDMELAQEANDMSNMEPAAIDDLIHMPGSSDESMAEDESQEEEYGDENALPIDPVLLAQSDASASVPPVTPQRFITRTFHTVSRVPLKPADESTPRPAPRRRSMSASRLPMSSRRRSDSVGRSAGSAGSAASSTTSSANTSPSKGGGGLTRSATVISYSPTKKDGRRQSRRVSRRRESFGGAMALAEMAAAGSMEAEQVAEDAEEAGAEQVPVTPTKSDGGWSTAGTPARTPRRDLDPALLRGAVVFVDVHTSEGADSGAIFVELLQQMGARCVKSWSWNPSSSPPSNADGSSRVGLTHVVFKDGSKRTLEKVRESQGLVQCVGVKWVLDCEAENRWVEEGPYAVDTAMVPRGGARRRKSMEPQMLMNLNGQLVAAPAKQGSSSSSSASAAASSSSSGFTTARKARASMPSLPTTTRSTPGTPSTPSTPMNRRDSTLWVRTPEEDYDKENGEGDGNGGGAGGDWAMTALLTPVPKTPAPETIARFAASITPSSPYGDDSSGYEVGDETLSTMAGGDDEDGRALVTRTCPAKPRGPGYHELGAGILAREKDEGVLQRLMAARRKSLQFAPKVASPLSKAWN